MTIAFNIEIWLIEACRSLATTPKTKKNSSFASILEKQKILLPIFARLICHCSWWSVKHAFELYLEWR